LRQAARRARRALLGERQVQAHLGTGCARQGRQAWRIALPARHGHHGARGRHAPQFDQMLDGAIHARCDTIIVGAQNEGSPYRRGRFLGDIVR